MEYFSFESLLRQKSHCPTKGNVLGFCIARGGQTKKGSKTKLFKVPSINTEASTSLSLNLWQFNKDCRNPHSSQHGFYGIKMLSYKHHFYNHIVKEETT